MDSNVKLVRDKGTNKLVPNAYTRTMMKIMQAVNDGNYDLERLQKLTQAAMNKDYNELKAEQGFDFDTYQNLRKGATIKQKMPTITTKDNECVPEKDPKQTHTKGSGNGKYTGTIKDSKGEQFITKDRNEFNAKKAELEKPKKDNNSDC